MLSRISTLLPCIFLLLVSNVTIANDNFNLANTSSPRNTLESFVLHSEIVIDYWKKEQLNMPEAQHAYTQVMRTLDLSLVPNRTRTVVIMERIILLREVLDRIDSSIHENPPNFKQVNKTDLQQWRFANTDIVIAKQLHGDKADQFLFSAATIQNLSRWYRTLALLPYNTDERSDDYQDFLRSPGPLFSKTFIASFPPYMNQLHGPLPLWQWCALLSILLICYFLIKASFLGGEHWNNRWVDKGVKWRAGYIFSHIGVVGILLLARKVIDDGVWLTGSVYQVFTTLFISAQFLFLSLLIMSIFNYLADIYAFKKHNGKQIDSSLITVLARIFGILTIAILGIYVISYMGFSISPIIAGFGVSGLAIALAIRPLLENVINGLTLYADGGIKIGELCRYGKNLGTIESIGLRSTRIRTLERSLITVPNSEFANIEIDNLERRDKRRMEHILRLRSETTPEQLRVVIVNVRRVLLRHPMIEAEPVRVRLMGVGEYSININVMAYICCRDQEEFMAVQEDLLFAIIDQVGIVGAKIAHSTQYQLVDKADMPTNEQKAEALKSVEKWHEDQNFPFPDFNAEYKYEIKDTIIYPASSSAVRRQTMT